MFELVVSSVPASQPSLLSWIPTVSPAVAIVVAGVAATISLLSVTRQWAFNRAQLELSHWEERSESIRAKRATAKCMRQEVLSIKSLVERGFAPEPIIFNKLIQDLGRLSTDCIDAIVSFHSEYGVWLKLDEDGQRKQLSALEKSAEKAVAEFKGFMAITRLELNQAKSEIDRLRFKRKGGEREEKLVKNASSLP